MGKKHYICGMGVTCLVWNIEKASDDRLLRITEAIRSWIASEDIHIVALLECSLANAKIINDQLGTDWQLISTDAGGMIRVFSRLKTSNQVIKIKEIDIWEGDYYSNILGTIQHLKPSLFDQEQNYLFTAINQKMRWFDVTVQGTLRLKIVFCHLYSKPSQQQNWNSSLLIASIQNLMYGYFNGQRNKILLAGDLNNNPFEMELYTNGDNFSPHFTSIPNRRVFESSSERIRNHFKDYFYNPTWALLSDAHAEGDYRTHYTYFHPKGRDDFKVNKDAYYFNCYDGVMMKKDVIPFFNHRRFKILDSYLQDGQTHSLITEDGIKINNDLYSDHLPIIFELDFTKENHGSDKRN